VARRAPDLEEYRRDVEAFLGAPAGADRDLQERLFSPDAVAGILVTAGDATGAGARAARALARFAAEGLLRAASADEMREIASRLTDPVVEAGGDRIPLIAVDAALAAEPDRERRSALQTARVRAIENRLGAPVAEARQRREEAARELGAASPEELLASAAGVDLAALAEEATRFLDAGDDLAAQALDRLARDALGVPGGDVDSADLPRLVRAPHLEADLPVREAAGAASRTLELLHLDTPRSPPTGSGLEGLAGYAEALREAGALAAAGGVSPRLPPEARLLPDPALAGGAGALLEGLLAEGAWISRVLGLPDPEPVARAAAAVRLLMARAAAEGVRVAAGLGDDDGLSRALGLPWPPILRLADGLAGLGAADDLRGRTLGAVLRAHMQNAHGSRWFAEGAAGGLLRELWLEGGQLDAEDLARELGSPGLDPEDLLAESAGAAG
jgi:hypothetical protein